MRNHPIWETRSQWTVEAGFWDKLKSIRFPQLQIFSTLRYMGQKGLFLPLQFQPLCLIFRGKKSPVARVFQNYIGFGRRCQHHRRRYQFKVCGKENSQERWWHGYKRKIEISFIPAWAGWFWSEVRAVLIVFGKASNSRISTLMQKLPGSCQRFNQLKWGIFWIRNVQYPLPPIREVLKSATIFFG